MNADLLVENGKLVLDQGIFDASVAIDDGRIVAIGRQSHMPKADETVDAEGCFVIPGIIDDHVHAFQFDDAISCSKAAAAGGVTTMMDHPIMPPTTTTAEAFEEKRKTCERDSFIDFCLLGGIIPGKLDEIPNLAKVGAVGFKAGIYDIVQPIFPRLTDGELLEAFKKIAEVDSIVGVHAENDEIISFLTRKLQEQGRKDTSAHEEARPVISELEATLRAILFARHAGNRLHIFHCSISEGVEAAYRAKCEGFRISVETCPHYLVLNKNLVEDKWAYGKMNPPVRSAEESERLWMKVREGKCDIIASDHAPWPREEKDKGKGNIWAAPGGWPGIQGMLTLMLSEGVNKNRFSIGELVKMMCENPAKIWRIYPRKGTIRIGSDGDLTIVDLKRDGVLGKEEYTKVGWTTYEGWKVKGMPVNTIVRGKVVAKDGRILGKQGFGEFVSPMKP